MHAQQKKSTVTEYKKVFTTYPFCDPAPVTDRSVQKEWKVVELENDYIKLMILPEVGGKIWAAIEKSKGKPFFYIIM